MPRKRRPLDRDAGVVRDASLIVVASEDKYAVESYFRRFRTKRVQFVVLPTEDSRSSPKDVMDRLDRYRKTEATEENDQFWVCIDSDHWIEDGHIRNLVDVLRQCRQKGYDVAISHPCIELWLLLHFADYTPAAVDMSVSCNDVIAQLKAVVGGYCKRNCDRLVITTSQVYEAVHRAKALDTSDDDLPDSPTTRVYRIVEVLKNRDSIALAPSPG